MLLSCLNNTVARTTIIANIVTSLGNIGIFFTVRAIAKNRVTRKTFVCELQRVQKTGGDESNTTYWFDLHVVNFTDSDCSISSIVLRVNGSSYGVFQTRPTSRWTEYVKVRDVYIKAHISLTLESLFVQIPKEIEPKQVALLLATTSGTLNYILDISDFRNSL